MTYSKPYDPPWDPFHRSDGELLRFVLPQWQVPRSLLSLADHWASAMNFDEFTGEIQHRLELPDTGRTVRTIRATLMTLGQRIPEGAADDLAASLPMEIKWYMTGAVEEHGQRFDWQEFLARVTEIEGDKTEPAESAYHARIIIDLVETLVPPSDFQQLRDQLPESEDDENWRKLFEVVDAGGWGDAQEAQTGGGPQPDPELQSDDAAGGESADETHE